MPVSKAKKGVFSASDEVDALRKRCGVLQGNLRAYKETTNATMGENKTRIDSLNKQNKVSILYDVGVCEWADVYGR